MRIPVWLHLLALCLIAGGLQATCSLAAPRQGPSSNAKTPLIKEEFKGYGLTPKDAEADALKNACDWLGERPDLGWAPAPEYLREKSMVHFGEPADEEFERAGLMKVVTMQLEINADQVREIQKHARQERMPSRHLLLARVLGGVVCLLIVVGGYLRLEEATKGYYTRLLRLAAIGIVVVIAVGLSIVG